MAQRAPSTATLTVIGCGDAFGSGGRMQTCFFVDSGPRFLIDCGASALIGLKKHNVVIDSIDAIVLTHLHVDHCGGVPFLVRETQIVGRRRRPLTIIGPPGMEAHVHRLMDVMFPGSTERALGFDLRFLEYSSSSPVLAAGLRVSAVEVVHSRGSAPHGVRVEWDGLTVAYSGDTEWVPALVSLADGADLFICECYRAGPATPNHLDYETLTSHRHELRCRRLLLTHMHDDMLALEDAEAMPERAWDGMQLRLGEATSRG